MGDTWKSGNGGEWNRHPVLSLFLHLLHQDVQELTSNWLSLKKHDDPHNYDKIMIAKWSRSSRTVTLMSSSQDPIPPNRA